MPGLLRHADVLVQPARSSRLVLLLGRCRGDAAPGAALPALHARVSRSPRIVGSRRRQAAGRAALRARRPAVHRQRDCRREVVGQHRAVFPRAHDARLGGAAVPVGLHDRRPRRADPCDGSRAVGHGAPSASLDYLGHRVRRGAVRHRLCAALCPGTAGLAADGAVGDTAQPRAAGVRIGAHPLPPDGRRSDRQAEPGVHRGHSGDLHDLRDAAAPGRRRVPRRRGAAQHDHRDAGDDRGRAAVQPGQERDSERARSRVLSRPVRLSARARRVRARSQQRPRSRPPERAPGRAHSRHLRHRSHGAPARRRGIRRLRSDPRRRVRRPRRDRPQPPFADCRQPRGRHGPVARRPADARRVSGRGDRVLARAGGPLLRAVRLEGGHHRGARARATRAGRAAEQRGHGAPAGRRQPRGDGSRQRPAVPATAAQGQRASAAAAVQREHRRVARQRAGRGRPERPCDSVESGAREHLRHLIGRGDGAQAGRGVRRPVHRGAARGAARIGQRRVALSRAAGGPCREGGRAPAREHRHGAVASADRPGQSCRRSATSSSSRT